MLIVIEGVDKTGKTTLAKEIEKRYNFKYKHFGIPGLNPATEYAKFLINLKEPTVCDRFYYGELIYGPMLRGKENIDSLQQVVIERLLRLKSAILIHASGPLEVISRRLHAMNDPLITEKQNVEAYHKFDTILAASTLTRFKFYAKAEDSAKRYSSLLDCLASELVKRSEIANKLATGIGTFYRPLYVLVGDELNESATWLGLPFDHGSCSDYLCRCLKRTKIPENSIYVVNSDTLTTKELTHLNWDSRVKFIALGATADKILNWYKVKHLKIPHPQYWKRFHASQENEYVAMLNEAAI